MDAGKGKSSDFMLSQALANQVVRKAEISALVFLGLLPVFHPLSSSPENGHSAYLLRCLTEALGRNHWSQRRPDQAQRVATLARDDVGTNR